MALTRNMPSPEGAELGAHLARLTAPEIEAYRAKFPGWPGPCASCAFRAGTVPNRCAQTVMDAVKCVAEREPFYCHEPAARGPDGEPTDLCRGWVIATASLPPDAEGGEMPWPYAAEALAEGG
jgi:hypothetical protein